MMTKSNKAALLSSLGAGLEYYDFIIYGMMAEHLSSLFFAADLPWINLAKAFAIFAVGYIARPFGGVLFGTLGDTYGRKKVFFSVMLLMAIATFSMGLLPTYAQIGPLAPCILVLLRVLQGLSFGAELPGAMTVVYEYGSERKRGLYAGLVLASTSIGAMLASLVLYVLSQALDKGSILEWGWRVPFLFGGLLMIANYFIRKNLEETPAFVESRANIPLSNISIKIPVIELFSVHWRQIFRGFGLSLFVSTLVITALYFPAYLSTYFGFASGDIYLATLWSMLWSAMLLPACGRLADKVGKSLQFFVTLVLFTLAAYPLFSLLHYKNFMALQLFMICHQTFIALVSGAYFPLLADLFPTRVRFTGIALCYGTTYAVVAGLPALMTALIRYTDSPKALMWALLVAAIGTGINIPRKECFLTLLEKNKAV